MTPKSDEGKAKPRITPATLLAGFAVLISCQLAGETLVSVARLLAPSFVFPGPVAGMLLLLAYLGWRRRLPAGLDAMATGLIGILSLLFVPSAVGIVQYGGLILEWGPPLLLALVISTLLTLLVTVGTYLALARLSNGEEP
ncbi:CidA/LrgA family protein [Devosia sp.]|uniref:CidA/LrgA family protein n=1 Tax=Devosia sp. TaxID=1871048 RepID=UPI0025D9C81D|nr:CidA/LrgA family protein [Devosia sp.]MCR6636275.1 CidA/LrgA family protein [Devosia sp.]